MSEKYFIRRQYHNNENYDIEKLEQEIKNETFSEKKFTKKEATIKPDNQVIYINDNFEQLKNELKAEIIRQGYNSISDFAEKNHGKYKASTIKMNLAKNNIHSEKVLAFVSKKLGFNFKKEIIYALEK